MGIAVAAMNTSKTIIKTQQGWRGLIKPYLFSTVAIGTSITLGDFICQYLERNRPLDSRPTSTNSLLSWWDRDRSLVMCISAVSVSTPWHFTVARTVERLFPGKQGVQIAKKIVTSTVLAPIGISLVFASVTLLKGQTFQDAQTKVQSDMPKTFLIGTCYWPLVSFVYFRFAPLDYRPFLGGLAGAVWNVYISSIANKAPETSDDGTSRNASTSNIVEISLAREENVIGCAGMGHEGKGETLTSISSPSGTRV